MAFNPNVYEHIYGFDIFDTIHNFFPEIMYDETLFVGDMNNWMRHRMNILFPAMYSRNQNLYRIYRSAPIREEYNNWRLGTATNEVLHTFPQQPSPVQFSRVPVRTPRSPTQPSRRSNVPVNPPRIERYSRVVRTSPENIVVSILSSSNLFPDIQESSRLWNRLGEDVEVAPTAEQITAASELMSHAEMPNETVCAICQDHESQSSLENWRQLHCHHAFHLSCIDSWFQRNVHCPVCRKDIREFSEPTR